MPKPIALCLEDLDAANPGERYLRCVALVGRQPSCRRAGAATVRWKDPAEAVEVTVSAPGARFAIKGRASSVIALVREAGELDGGD